MELFYNNLVRIEIVDKLPKAALKMLKKMGFTDNGSLKLSDPVEFSVKLGKLNPERIQRIKNDALDIDQSWFFSENSFSEKCRYKFSRWKYVFTKSEEGADFEFYFDGDFFSSWVWPQRSLAPLIFLFLYTKGYYFLHAAAFVHSGEGIMMLAPSGTGKTLTSLHWLCDNNTLYSDDTIIVKDYQLIPNLQRIRFWAHRYRGSSNVLPDNFPKLDRKDRWKTFLYRVMNKLTLGRVAFGLGMCLDKYWQEQIVGNPVQLKRIVALRKGNCFKINKSPDRERIKNILIGDFMFQNLPLLRLKDASLLGNFEHLPCREYFDDYVKKIESSVDNYELVELVVPSLYSKDLYKEVSEVIKW